jgi:hypothetical protein
MGILLLSNEFRYCLMNSFLAVVNWPHRAIAFRAMAFRAMARGGSNAETGVATRRRRYWRGG